MRDLSVLRHEGNFFQREETELLRSMSPQESLLAWLDLQVNFAWQLEQTDHLFEQDRRDALAELQARLLRLRDKA